MGSIHALTNMHSYGPGWELYWEIDRVQGGDGDKHGEIVVRVRPKAGPRGEPWEPQRPEHGHEVCRLGWPHHVYRPAEPLHENIMAMIAESLVAALREAHEAGRRAAMADVRQLIGAAPYPHMGGARR